MWHRSLMLTSVEEEIGDYADDDGDADAIADADDDDDGLVNELEGVAPLTDVNLSGRGNR